MAVTHGCDTWQERRGGGACETRYTGGPCCLHDSVCVLLLHCVEQLIHSESPRLCLALFERGRTSRCPSAAPAADCRGASARARTPFEPRASVRTLCCGASACELARAELCGCGRGVAAGHGAHRSPPCARRSRGGGRRARRHRRVGLGWRDAPPLGESALQLLELSEPVGRPSELFVDHNR